MIVSYYLDGLGLFQERVDLFLGKVLDFLFDFTVSSGLLVQFGGVVGDGLQSFFQLFVELLWV